MNPRDPITQEEADEISKRLTALGSENTTLRSIVLSKGTNPVLALKVLEGELRERLVFAHDNSAKRRAMNALLALESIAEFLGGAGKTEGGAK